MTLPFFYVENLVAKTITLDEDTSKHINVLRMQKGEEILLTDGKGKKAQAHIIDDNRKKCVVEIYSSAVEEKASGKVCIAISLLKNASRFEWFLEKATEIGVTQIIPLLCERTEKEKFRYERLNAILISAMLQSQQCRLPVLCEPVSFQKLIAREQEGQSFIAHCLPDQKEQLSTMLRNPSSIILIGPEGDFTENEIGTALEKGFKPVALGNTRLRTETAGIVAATLVCNGI